MTTGSRFCPRCGAALQSVPPTRCPGCSYELFVNARPTATVIVVRDGEFLSVRRAIEPFLGMWELPGGFCDGWEHPSDAALREVREEVGLTVRLDDFVGCYIGEYRFQDELVPVLDFFWTATIETGEVRPDPHEVSEFGWRSLQHPPSMAFPNMDRALVDARKFV